MSSLLDEAIVDAKALREAVLKNAEASLLEAYAPKIEEAVVQLLEQDPAAAALPMDIGSPPPDIGALPGGLDVAPEEVDVETADTFLDGEEEDLDIQYAISSDVDGIEDSESDEIEITQGELEQMLESIVKDIEVLEEMHCPGSAPGKKDDDEEEHDEHVAQSEAHLMEIDEDVLEAFTSLKEEETMLTEESVHHVVKAGDTLSAIAKEHEVTVDDIMKHKRNNIKSADDIKVGQKIFIPMPADIRPGNTTKESTEISEETIDEIVESLVVDMMPMKRGWAGTPESEMQFNEKLAAAMAQSDKFKEERDELLKVGKELTESITKHQRVNTKMKEVVDVLKEKLDEVNLNNARLLYTNRVLRESSLNERQKETIVEALSNAGSVNEAKVIFETLQSTVGTSTKKSPKSLSEAVSRPSTILPRRKSQNTQPDSFTDRMKVLAGIKN